MLPWQLTEKVYGEAQNLLIGNKQKLNENELRYK